MAALDEFLAAYEAGNVIFFAGAGASLESWAPGPRDILKYSADSLLPDEAAYRGHIDDVLDGETIAGSPLRGIQPEIFYEHALSICADLRALSLWRILSPPWLAEQGVVLRPNLNHLAIVRYAAATGLPVFTTNFDMLFEAAAVDLHQARCEVVLPFSKHETDVVYELAKRNAPDLGKLTLFKLHGSICIEGREALDSIRTTMQSITTTNWSALELLRREAEHRHLVFLGYSGSDIDYFPALATAGLPKRPFWFNPNGDPIARGHLERLNAIELAVRPSQVFAEHDPHVAAPVPAPKVDYAPLFRTLAADIPSFRPAEKILLLAMCLNSIGRNRDAETLLVKSLDRLRDELRPRELALALIHLARIEDCTSRYVRAEGHAEEALAVARAARRSGLAAREATALEVRALCQAEMVRQQQVGPNIAFGNARVDWRPSASALLWRLAHGIWLTIRLVRLRRRLPMANASPSVVRAQHAMNDHLLTMVDRIVSVTQAFGAARMPVLGSVPRIMVHALSKLARDSGDYFVYAQSQRSALKLSGSSSADQTAETYRLLRDPLNDALAHRDTAVERLRSGEPALAAHELRLALAGALRSGSDATVLKVVIGLHACDAATPEDNRRLSEVVERIEGLGYRRYVAWVSPRLGLKF